MPNVQNVAFDPTMPPELAAQQMQLQRQQELANYLRQQSLEPLQSQTVHTGAGAPDQVVKFSPIQGLVKALQAVQGGDMQSGIDSDRLAMARQLKAGRDAEVAKISGMMYGKPAQPGTPIASPDNPQGAIYTDEPGVAAADQEGYKTLGTPATAPASRKELAAALMGSTVPEFQQQGLKHMFDAQPKADVHTVAEGGKLVQIGADGTPQVIAEGTPKRIPTLYKEKFVNGPKGEPYVQKEVSLDNGVTWKNEGEASPKFARQVAPVINVGDQPEKLTPAGQKVADDLIANGKPLPGGWGKNGISRGNSALNRLGEGIYGEGGSGIPLSQQQNEGAAAKTAETKFTSGPQADTIRSLGVANSHLDLLSQLSAAQQNNDVVLANKVQNMWRIQTGSALPTNPSLAAEVIGKEIVKALGVAGAGTGEERDKMAANFSNVKSPEQLNGAIATARALLGGQVQGMSRQYEAATRKKDFNTRFGFTPQGNVIKPSESGGWKDL